MSRENSSKASQAKNRARSGLSFPSEAAVPASINASSRETVRPSGPVAVSFLKPSKTSRIWGNFSATSLSTPDSFEGSATVANFSRSTERRSSAQSLAAFALSKFDVSEAKSAECAFTKANAFSLGTARRRRSKWSAALPQKTSMSKNFAIPGNAFFVSMTIFASETASDAYNTSTANGRIFSASRFGSSFPEKISAKVSG